MSDISERIAALKARADRDYESFEPPAEGPDEERALEYLVDGAGDAVGLYIDARTGEQTRIAPADFSMLEEAFNDWLELYTRCYGVDIDGGFTLREAAEVVLETHSIRDTALLLTQVPDRDRSEPWSSPE